MLLIAGAAVRPTAAQVSRVGVPGRADYNPYFGVALTDPRLRQVLSSTDAAFLLGLVTQGARGVGFTEVGESDPPADLAILAADRLAGIRAFGVSDSLLALDALAARMDSFAPGPQGARLWPLRLAIRNFRYALAFRAAAAPDVIHAMLDSLRTMRVVTSAELQFVKSLGREAADSLRDRFLTTANQQERFVYFEAMTEMDDPGSIPLLESILARGAEPYGSMGGSEDAAAHGLLEIGTLPAILALRDALVAADNLGTYRTRPGYDPVNLWRTKLVQDLTGHTIDEWIDILNRPTEPPPVAAQANPSPLAWNLRWRKDVPSSQAQVSIEVGNIAGGRDPRTLVLASIRLNGAMGAIALRAHDQGNSRWTGPWVEVVFRQRDAIELVPLGAKPGDSFAATLTGTLTDNTRITTPVTVRLVGP